MSSSKHEKVIKEILSDERGVRVATEPHQRDLPYERDEEAQVTRREFCNFLALTSTAPFADALPFRRRV